MRFEGVPVVETFKIKFDTGAPLEMKGVLSSTIIITRTHTLSGDMPQRYQHSERKTVNNLTT